jgi:D-aminoacyl-tRNA deacylase
MRIVVQRVSEAAVEISGSVHAKIGPGLLVLLGITHEDAAPDIEYLVGKLCSLRIFPDADGKMNLDVRQVQGDVLVVSQFTLHASTRKGNRPSFIAAAPPQLAVPLYQKFIKDVASALGRPCYSGIFGADMKVSLVNDGPVTIIIDSRDKE